MSIYAVTGVTLDESGRVTEAAVSMVDPGTRKTIGMGRQMMAHEVASLIHQGNKVCSVFITEGGTVLGPDFRYTQYGQGVEGIDLERHEEGKTLQDLVLQIK